jgi:proline iminopeptidase
LQIVETLGAGSWLEPAEGHAVWWAQGGDPQGVPVVLVHGGPGGASREDTVRWWQAQPVRWIAVDQRGCGRSLPLGRRRHNDLEALVADMERLRMHLGLVRWGVAGGSWGARVALAYAARHPQRTAGLFLRSPFLGSDPETRRYIEDWPVWLGTGGEAWLGRAHAEAVAAVYQGATARSFFSDTGFVRGLRAGRVASVWSAFDDAQSAPGGVRATGARFKAPASDAVATTGTSTALLAAWRIHLDYAQQGWGGAGHEDARATARKMEGPVSLVWGAADATCDPAQARWLATCFASAVAEEEAEAGHRMSDARLAPALAAAAVAWARRLRAVG